MTYDTHLGKVINQGYGPLKPGDIDDCGTVAAFQTASAVGGLPLADLPQVTAAGHKVTTIPAFRAIMGKPDVQGQSNGVTAADILKGILGSFNHVQAALSSGVWETFRAGLVKQGKVASVMVVSAKLPLSYGFKGLHEVTIRAVGPVTAPVFYIANPLAPHGSPPIKIAEKDLKAAVLAYDGKVHAVLCWPEEPVVVPPPVVEPPIVIPPPPPVVDCQPAVDAAYEQGINEGIASEKKRMRDLLGL